MAGREGWTHLRIKAGTKRRLQALAERLTAAAQRGQGKTPQSDAPCPGGEGWGVTLDAALNRALDLAEDKLNRSARKRPTRTGYPLIDEFLNIAADAELDMDELSKDVDGQ